MEDHGKLARIEILGIPARFRQELAGENGDEEPEPSTTSHGGRHWIMVLSLASKMESVLFFLPI